MLPLKKFTRSRYHLSIFDGRSQRKNTVIKHWRGKPPTLSLCNTVTTTGDTQRTGAGPHHQDGMWTASRLMTEPGPRHPPSQIQPTSQPVSRPPRTTRLPASSLPNNLKRLLLSITHSSCFISWPIQLLGSRVRYAICWKDVC